MTQVCCSCWPWDSWHLYAGSLFGESADLAIARTAKRRKRTPLTAKTKRGAATERTKALRKAQTGRPPRQTPHLQYTAQKNTEPPATSIALRTEGSPLIPVFYPQAAPPSFTAKNTRRKYVDPTSKDALATGRPPQPTRRRPPVTRRRSASSTSPLGEDSSSLAVRRGGR